MKIAILGATGMLGSITAEVFAETNHEIVLTTREQSDTSYYFDAQTSTDDELRNIISGCDYVINCIGIIKPYIHDDNSEEVQRAIEVNALLPHRLSSIALGSNTKIIQIATDCVFNGVKGQYTETDIHNASDVYGKTKSLGEVYASNFINIRCSIIGHELKGRLSLLEWFLNQPHGASLNGYTDHKWNGLTTLAFAKICRGIVNQNIELGHMQHVLPQDEISKADILKLFAKTYGRDDLVICDIEEGSGIDRTVITNNPTVNNKLWLSAGYNAIPTLQEMIVELRDFHESREQS